MVKSASALRFSNLFRIKYLALVVVLLFSLTGCVEKNKPEPMFVTMHSAQNQEQAETKIEKEKKADTETEKKEAEFVRLESYDIKKGYSAASHKKNQFSTTEKVSIAVDNMKLSEFITYVFSDIFNLDFVIDPSISKVELEKPVVLNVQHDISKNKLFSILSNLLAQHKIIIVEKDGIFFVQKDTGNSSIAFGMGMLNSDIPDVPGKVIQLVPVKYADVDNLHNFLPKSGSVNLRIARGENMFILSGKRDEILRIVEMIRVLDRPAMRGRYIGSCKFKYIDPVKGVKKLKSLLIEEGIPVALGAGKKGVFFIPMEKQGLLIYFAAQQKWISRLEYWIKVIDKPEKTDKKEYNIYFPENSRAVTLFESLKMIMPGTSDAGPVTKQTKESGEKNNTSNQNASVTSDDLRLSVDDGRNALIVYSTPERYAIIEDLLEKLDIMPVQVLIEASIIEVTLTDKLQYGLEWYLRAGGRMLKTKDGLDLGSGGLDFSLVSDVANFEVVINAMAKDDSVKILSNPRITVKDGKSASIMVGTEVPVIVSEAVSADSVSSGTSDTVRSVQYRSTGISLNVTPRVHSRGVVSLEISQEVSEAAANTTSEISSPIILNRSISTEVVAKDGQTILLGGLIKENNSDTVLKVPILGDIPILGYLFKTTSTGGDRTELVIMITPHIIRNSFQIDEMREAIFKGFKSIEKQ